MRSATKPKTTHLNQPAGRSAARLTVAAALALAVGLGGAGTALAAPGGPTDLCAPHPKRSLSISDDFVYEHEKAVMWVELSGPACYYVKVDYATTGFGTAQAATTWQGNDCFGDGEALGGQRTELADLADAPHGQEGVPG